MAFAVYAWRLLVTDGKVVLHSKVRFRHDLPCGDSRRGGTGFGIHKEVNLPLWT